MRYIPIKAIETESGDWQLDVLGLPYGGPDNLDSDGEYFSPDTNTHADKFGLPPAVYYHGFGTDKKPMGKPEYIGRTVKRWTDAAGEWFRVVLDKTSKFARRVWDSAQKGEARASSGSVAHLVRKATDGLLSEWPVAELSIFDAVDGREPANRYAVAIPVMKALYTEAGLALPDIDVPEATPEAQKAAVAERENDPVNVDTGETEMEKNEVQELVAEQVAAALKAEKDEREAEEAKQAAIKAAADEAVKAAREEWEKEAAKSGRLPTREAPAVIHRDGKFNHSSADDIAVMIGVLNGANADVSEGAYKALAMRLESAEEKDSEPSQLALKALKGAMGGAYKSDELQQSTLSSYGDDWVGVQYSNRLWESIRAENRVVAKLPDIEVPQGMESIVIPLESGDPTWYKVSQAASLPTTEATGWPNATVTSSQVGTAKQTLSVDKAGARILWTGEMDEDSLIPFLPHLRMKLQVSGSEILEHLVIDGDTTTSASTNINDIAGTPAGTEAFLLMDGFRKLALVTNTDNARDGGAITVDDYLETAWLMGTAGLNGADVTKVGFIIDPNVMKKTMQLEEIKTKDVYSQPMIEGGQLRGLWGYEIIPSWQMHRGSSVRKATTAGCIDLDTTGNNSTGSILAVRWDQWLFGWKRRMTIETTRIARADAYEIVAFMRVGLKYRDTEASAISYNLTV